MLFAQGDTDIHLWRALKMFYRESRCQDVFIMKHHSRPTNLVEITIENDKYLTHHHKYNTEPYKTRYLCANQHFIMDRSVFAGL